MFLDSRKMASEHIYVWIFPVSKEAAMLIIVKKNNRTSTWENT